ncbi:MAG TPA: glycosyltransferase [Vicinamibacterales bacterium]
MKILWLNAGLLLPLDKGGKLRTWHLMRHLARRHAITYLCFTDPDEKKEHLEGMAEVCNSLVTVARRDPAKGTPAFYVDAVKHLLDPLPYAVGKYASEEYAGKVRHLLEHRGFDLLVVDFLPPVVNLPPTVLVPKVLFTHNVEAEIWRRHAEVAANPVARVLLRQQWQRMLRFERGALTRFDLVLAVSDTDRDTFSRLYPGALRRPIHVVQTGVDTSYFSPTPHLERRAHLVFTGSMDWLPNEDGMAYFVGEILPRIRQTEPEATLSIVGRAPTPAVRRLAETAGVEVTGRVDDVRPHIAAGAVYVVPLRIGGGTRLKIFEAMSMSRAVVSTTIGAEGLPVTPGRDIVIADDPDRFAKAVIHLIRDVDARRRIEAAARQVVVDRYDWATVARHFERALETARSEPHVNRMSA